MRRGDIFLGNVQRETNMEKERPVLIIQNDKGNQYSPDTIVAVFRTDRCKELPVHVSLPSGVAGLTKDSVVDCGHIATIKKKKMGKFIGCLPEHYMEQVDRALCVSLELD